MTFWIRALTFLVVAGLAFGFAVANGDQRVTVELGVATLQSVPLPVLVFVAVLAGMLAVFLAGLRADLRTRRTLRRYREVIEGEE